MQATCPTARTTGWPVRLALLLVALLFTVGCGDSSEDYVFTGTNNNNNPAQTGALTFNFVKAQSPLQVPQSTVDIRFEFFDGPNGTGQQTQPTQVLDFATVITISPVAVTTRSVVVTALGPGNVPLVEGVANVAVTAGNTTTVDFDDATVTTVTLASLSVSPATASIEVGDTQTFSASATYSNGDTIPAVGVTWSSSAPSVASINASTGVATGLTLGDTTITATVGSTSDTAELEVTDEVVTPVLTTLTVAPDGENVGIGGLKQFTVTGIDQNGDAFSLANSTVVWTTTSNVEINSTNGASVIVEGVAEGTANVTATVGAVTDFATVTVFEPALDGIVSVSPDPLNLFINTTTTGTLTTIGSFGTAPDRPLTNAEDTLNYIIGDTRVANVTSDGLVTPLAVGDTTITAVAGNFSQTVVLTVRNAGGNQNPVVSFDDQTVAVEQNDGTFVAFSNVSVTDDQAQLSGGVLSIEASGPNTDVMLNSTSGVSIGTVSGDGTSNIQVDLDSNASPDNIAAFLEGIVISSASGAELGNGRITVGLSDGFSPTQGSNSADEPSTGYVVFGQGAGVYFVGPTRTYTTIQSAVDEVATTNATSSVIVVDESNYNETVTIAASVPSGLQILGPNEGNSAGAGSVNESATLRVGEAQVARFNVDAADVTIDGFTIYGAGFDGNYVNGRGVDLGSGADDFRLANSIVTSQNTGSGKGVHHSSGDPITGATLADNFFGGWDEGVRLSANTGVTISGILLVGNIFDGNDVGFASNRPINLGIFGNSFFDNTAGPGPYNNHIAIELDGGGIVNVGDISGNDFSTGDTGSVQLYGSGTLPVDDNYWGGGAPVSGVDVKPNDTVVPATNPNSTPFTNYPPVI